MFRASLRECGLHHPHATGLLIAVASLALGAEPVGISRAEERGGFDRGGCDEPWATGLAATPLEESLPNGIRVTRFAEVEPDGGVALHASVVNRTGIDAPVERIPLFVWERGTSSSDDAIRYERLEHRDEEWYGSTFWSGPDWTRVGKDWQHSGEATSSVRVFTAPRSGRVLVSGRAFKADTNNGGGDGVRLSIRHGARTVWTAELDGDDTQGVVPSLQLELREGDRLRFVVHKRGDIYHDTTHWAPAVTFEDGRSFDASAGFSAERGDSPWSYELERNADDLEGGGPRVVGLDSHFGLVHARPTPGHDVHWTGSSRPPIWIVHDGWARRGVGIVLDAIVAWDARISCVEAGSLRLEVSVVTDGAATAGPGGSPALPDVLSLPYEGSWLEGASAIERALRTPRLSRVRKLLRRQFLAAYPDPLRGSDESPGVGRLQEQGFELDLWAWAQAEWLVEDGFWTSDYLPSSTASQDLAAESTRVRDAAAGHTDKAWWLLSDLSETLSAADLAARKGELGALSLRVRGSALRGEEAAALYLEARWWKRRLALSNPLFRQGGPLLFAKRVPTSYSHLVMQYFGWRARAGGGLFVLERPGDSLDCRDILHGRLSSGNVLEPRLSYDAKRVVFSYVEVPPTRPEPSTLTNDDPDVGFYHVFEVGIDGSGFRQLTRGPYEDLMPTYLPGGDIVFSSTRRRGHARCFGAQFSARWHVYALHRMGPDGTDVRPISFHDTNEWFPSIAHDGRVLYSRWDYIDRDAVTHQNLWSTNPDGTNAFALWGNATPSPHCTFQIRPVPGSYKIAFCAAPHHSIAAGSLALLDPTSSNDGHGGITRLTPDVPFPEAEGRDIRRYYAAPFPLSETYLLVAYSHRPLVWEPGANDPSALGIYLLDAFGNRELLYRDARIGSTSPCFLSQQPAPPVLSDRSSEDIEATGEVVLLDVYRGLGAIPRGTVKSLRVVQIFPKTTPLANLPPIGLAGEENGRAILGTVPVDEDGSARFLVPASRPILFQALDADGFAIQVMRSVAYVQSGERLACVGCHENRRTAPPNSPALALRRPPSRLETDQPEATPFSFVETVQPILDRHCVECHGAERDEPGIDLRGTPDRGYTRSYWSLCGDRNFWGEGTNERNARESLVPRFGARNTIQVTPPGGLYGARGSRLIRLLRDGHHDVKLDSRELRQLGTWIDLNAIFYGVYEPAAQAAQLRGERVPMPAVQ